MKTCLCDQCLQVSLPGTEACVQSGTARVLEERDQALGILALGLVLIVVLAVAGMSALLY